MLHASKKPKGVPLMPLRLAYSRPGTTNFVRTSYTTSAKRPRDSPPVSPPSNPSQLERMTQLLAILQQYDQPQVDVIERAVARSVQRCVSVATGRPPVD